ncbi:PIN domain-containing protein [Actinoplanes sp. RD1]|uniref:PIN domain-containing protein n=1 Tax=Actinoplanes sp. RD1 TaxID=3064538 RepID=UPI0027409162|nr:PIN domain-containing protein [Actinoplanes sp. RD1]
MLVVLADANVLYSRVLRDYLLYAADQKVIAIAWSPSILPEVTEHLERNVAGFDVAAGRRLTLAMNRAFPFAGIEPSAEHQRLLDELLTARVLPDEGDRHVLVAVVASEATVLCTSITKDFPADIMEILHVEVLTPDELFSRLIAEFELRMLAAHRAAVTSLKGATDRSTIEALHRAGATTTAGLMSRLLLS